jgi:Fe-S oxidoreductase
VTDLRRAAELCEFCPKMCRFSCPVSEATFREALSPWGKVSLAALSGAAPGPPVAEAFAGCTGCLRCQQYCAHANDVPRVLYAARASSVRAGTALAAWTSTAERFRAAGHAEDVDLLAVHRAVSAGETAASRSRPAMLFAGCDALSQGGDLARAALAVARELGAPLGLAPETALCCGLKLVEAGHPDEFAAHAARVRGIFGPAPVNLIFLTPGCARAARERWPALPPGSRVEHVTTYLARALASRGARAERPPLPISVTWHDPCELSRGLAEVTAPRALLAAAVEEVREPIRTGVDTSCCGAAGLLPRSLPEVAASIASLRRTELDACGAKPVTASPACASALGAEDLVVLLADWLGLSRSTWRRPS